MPSDEEIARYGRMRDRYVRRLAAAPFSNRYTLALSIGAEEFSIPIPVLQAARDQRQPHLAEDRQRLMAFSRVVSLGRQLNTWKGIARSFCRQHPTVINATQKYGAQIAAALEMSR